jgi:hypothetical protein
MTKVELIRCAAHNGACWVQLDGSHKSPECCTCFDGVTPPYLCPIDGHSLKYILRNPEWTDAEAISAH